MSAAQPLSAVWPLDVSDLTPWQRHSAPTAHLRDVMAQWQRAGAVEVTVPETPCEAVPNITPDLADVHSVFQKWLGQTYDTEVLDVVLATAVGHWLPGDPLWLLVVGGSGDAKTETVCTLQHIEAIPVRILGSITSAGALLTGLGKKDQDSESTGGLLRQIPTEAVVVFKDFTSILSLGRDARNSVLSAFREIYDGTWGRSTGGGGGRTEEWKGRWIVVAAVTTAIDTTERDASSKMGDRFAIIRMSEDIKRRHESGLMSSLHQGDEMQMRKELAAAVRLLFRRVDAKSTHHLSPHYSDRLLSVVDLVTRARSGVEYSHSGAEVVYAHAPEAPTRLLKQLIQLWHGAVVVGHTEESALLLCFRVAFESMPPMRQKILHDLAVNRSSTISTIAERLQKPETSVRRELQALHGLGVLTMSKWEKNPKDPKHSGCFYRLRDDAVDGFAQMMLVAF